MSDEQARDWNEPVHPIQVVSRRTGLGADLIRAWERRYGAVEPQRSTRARRLYSDADVERLGLLRRVTQAGRRIGDVAGLDTEALKSLVAEDEAIAAPVQQHVAGQEASVRIERCLNSVAALKPKYLEDELYHASVELTLPVLLDRLLGPLFRRIGEAVAAGELRIVHEHMATAVATGFLNGLRPMATPNLVLGPRIIVTTPAGQVHELGALMAAVTAAAEGWDVLYLGPNLPADEIAAAAQQVGAAAVALSVICLDAEPRLRQELQRLRQQLPEATLFMGGGYADLRPDELKVLQAVPTRSYAEFREALELARPRLSV